MFYKCLNSPIKLMIEFHLYKFIFVNSSISRLDFWLCQLFLVLLCMRRLHKILAICAVLAYCGNLGAQNKFQYIRDQLFQDSIYAIWELSASKDDAKYFIPKIKQDLKSGKANLMLQGSIAPVVYPGKREKFKAKYGIGWMDFGCVVECSERQMVKVNTAIMDYLTGSFGNEWKKDIRPDIPGIDKYGTKAFNNIIYGKTGTATVVVPAVFKSTGTAGTATRTLDTQNVSVVKNLTGSDPTISIQFLYRGIEYSFPISCDVQITKQPTENELIGLIIEMFDPQKFGYSSDSRPYPYGVVKAIYFMR